MDDGGMGGRGGKGGRTISPGAPLVYARQKSLETRAPAFDHAMWEGRKTQVGLAPNLERSENSPHHASYALTHSVAASTAVDNSLESDAARFPIEAENLSIFPVSGSASAWSAQGTANIGSILA